MSNAQWQCLQPQKPDLARPPEDRILNNHLAEVSKSTQEKCWRLHVARRVVQSKGVKYLNLNCVIISLLSRDQALRSNGPAILTFTSEVIKCMDGCETTRVALLYLERI